MLEAHAHIAAFGRSLTMPDLSGCSGPQDAIARLREAAASLRAGEWLLSSGVRVEGWREPRWPTRDELDRAVDNRPACVMSFDHHAVLASSAAMRAAGFRDDSPDPPGGVIVRDASGRPTGLLLEDAAWTTWKAAPEPPPEQRVAHVRAALSRLAALGYTEVHDLLAPTWLGEAIAGLCDAGELPMRVGLFAPLAEVEAQHAASRRWSRERVRLLGGKIFVDGTLNSATAYVREPYAHPLPGKPRGVQLLDEHQVLEAIERCGRVGLGLAAHAIGDAAVDTVLDAVARHRGAGGGTPVRIEHAELVAPDAVPRFAALGVVASVQPCHLLADVECLRRQFPDRLSRVLPLRSLIGAGLTPGEGLIFGSDVPIVGPDPADSIQAATRRRRPGTPETDAIAPEQAITPNEARRCFGVRL